MALIFVACAGAWQAQAREAPRATPVFRVFGSEDGLPSRQVHALAQDAQGRLWIGTANGLVRFDGQQFRAYPARLEQPRALASTSVEALTIDARGRPWVATQGGHLAYWQAQTNDFERVDLRRRLKVEQLETWALASIGQRIWVGTYGAGLLELDLDGQVLQQHAVPESAGGPHVLDLLATPDGELWMISYARRLSYLDFRSGRLSTALQATDGSDLVAHGIGLRAGRPWISTSDGRSCVVPADHQVRCAALPLLALPARARLLLSGERGDFVGGMAELLRLNDGHTQHIKPNPGSIGGLSAHALWTGLVDRDQGLWFGSSGGGLLYLPASADQFQTWQPNLVGGAGLRDGRVRGVAHDANGTVWLATLNAGLHRLQPGSGHIDSVALPGIDQRRVWAVLSHEDGLWVAHQSGLLRLAVGVDGQLHSDRQWPAEQLVGPIIDLLYRDDQAQLWAASMGAGLNRIDAESDTVWRYPIGEKGLSGTEVQQIGRGVDGRTWVATDRALHAYESSCDCWQALIHAASVDAFADDGADSVYVFADGQLLRYRWRDGLFRDESLAPRNFAEFQTVGGLVVVDQALWLTGPQGLYRYWPNEDRLEAFDSRDGLVSRELSDRPPYVDAVGRLWVGSEDGLLSLDPRSQREKTPPAQLRFELLSVDGPSGSRQLAPTPAEIFPDERELQVVVRFDSLARAHAQRFSFRLRGYDDWSAPTTRPERSLGTLPAGQYTLQVRGWDGYGQAAANTLSWPVRVLPPWWRSTWALSLYGLSFVLLLAAIEIWRRRRRQAEQLWRETQRQAQWAEQLALEKTALVAELSHEIRNPLNGVLGMARLLHDEALPATAQRYLGLLTQAGQQLARLMDDVLDWSRLGAQSSALPRQPVALGPTLAPVVARYAQLAAERQLRFVIELDARLAVWAEPSRLQQIVENLLSNACKFTREGGIKLSARSTGEAVELRVEDSGVGLSAAEIERLFHPFERVGDQRAAPGSGLGLAISRRLAQRMGAALWVESQAGVGSCFVLSLAQAAEQPNAAGPMEVAPLLSLPAAQVLIVEDDPIGRELLQRELTALGLRVTAVSDALSALILVQQQAFAAALLDWDLPGMSGLELARSLRVQQPSLPLLAVTGRTSPADRALAIETGFAAHLAKPLDPQQLRNALQAVLSA